MLKIAVTGHRPTKLGGYDWNSEFNQKMLSLLYNAFERLITDEDAIEVRTGGALGIDQMSFQIVNMLKEKYPNKSIRNILCVPFFNQAHKWPAQSANLYDHFKSIADEVIYIDTLPDYTTSRIPIGEYHVAKMQRRNEYMVDHSDVLLAYWDGSKGGTSNCVEYAQKKGIHIINLATILNS